MRIGAATASCNDGRPGIAELLDRAGPPDLVVFMVDGSSVAEVNSLVACTGAFPIAAAPDAGADVVVTGRVVDRALAPGAPIHAFGRARTIPTCWPRARLPATCSTVRRR